MPYAVGAVALGLVLMVIWPYLLILLGIGLISALIGWLFTHPWVSVPLVVSIYWLWSVYLGKLDANDILAVDDKGVVETISDASLSQGGRWCITVRAATITLCLWLLCILPFIVAFIAIAVVIATHFGLEQNGTIVKQRGVRLHADGTGVFIYSLTVKDPDGVRRVYNFTPVQQNNRHVIHVDSFNALSSGKTLTPHS